MAGTTYICGIYCDEECAHHTFCMIRSDSEHPHGERHVGYDFAKKKTHSWRVEAQRRVCRIEPG
jgi:hypothetical protein